MTGEPPPPTQTIPPGTPDEKLALLIATLLDIILTILEALPIPGFLRRPLQNRARHECAALLTRLLATRVPKPHQPACEPIANQAARAHAAPAPNPAQQPTRAPKPAGQPASPVQITEPGAAQQDATQPKPRSRPHYHPTCARHRAGLDRSPAQNFQKPAKVNRNLHAHIVTIS